MNTTEFLVIAGAIVPARPAVLFEGQQFTFAQMQERVNRLANALADLGVSPGDRIATMQVNCHQGIEIYFAAALLDAIYVPLNFRAQVRRTGADAGNCPTQPAVHREAVSAPD